MASITKCDNCGDKLDPFHYTLFNKSMSRDLKLCSDKCMKAWIKMLIIAENGFKISKWLYEPKKKGQSLWKGFKGV